MEKPRFFEVFRVLEQALLTTIMFSYKIIKNGILINTKGDDLMGKTLKSPTIVILAVSVALVVILASCGASKSSASSSAPAAASAGSDQKITLNTMNYETSNVDVDKQISEMFNKLHPNVTVNIVEKDWDQYFTLLATQFQSGNPPDAFGTNGISNNTLASLVDQGMCEPMEMYFDKSQYADWYVRVYTYKGHTWAIPGLYMDALATYYNKAVFAKYNLQPPKSMADMDNIMDTLLKNGVQPFTMPGKSADDTAFFLDTFIMSYAADWNSKFPYQGAKFADKDFVDAIKLFVTWRDKGYFGKDYQANDVATSVMQLLQGKAGMFLNGEWHAADMNDSPDIGVFYMKRPDGKDAGMASSKQSYALSVYSKGPNKDMAIEFAKFFASPEVQQLMGDVSTSVPGDYPAAKGKVSSSNPIIQGFMNPDHSELGFLDSAGSVQKTGVDFFAIQTAAIQKLLFKQISVDEMISTYDTSVDYNNIIQ